MESNTTTATLDELLEQLAADPASWRPLLYGQRAEGGGLPGASLGPPFPISPGADRSDVEAAIVTRVGGPVECLVRLKGAGRAWSRWARVVVDTAAAHAYLSPPAPPSSSSPDLVGIVAALAAQVDALTKKLENGPTPSATSLIPSDPFNVALTISKIQTDAFDKAIATMKSMLPTQQGPVVSEPSLYSELGALRAKVEMGATLGKAINNGVDWTTVIAAIAPTLDKIADRALTTWDKSVSVQRELALTVEQRKTLEAAAAAGIKAEQSELTEGGGQ